MPKTPGETAYAAYVAAVDPHPVAARITAAMWARLLPAEQRAWDAVAQAVLAMPNPAVAQRLDVLIVALDQQRDTFDPWDPPHARLDEIATALRLLLASVAREAPYA